MQDFIRNNRGINDGGDLELDFMEDIYNRIVHNEIKMKVQTHVSGTMFGESERA